MKKKYIRELLAADLSKQKALDEDSRPIQQIIFAGKIKQKVIQEIILKYQKKQC